MNESENQKTIKKTLLQLNDKLSDNIVWAVFGGVAVAIHNKNFYRECEDVDVIIENDKNKISSLLNSHKVCFKTRNTRERGYFTIGNVKFDLLFLTGGKKLDLADGPFKFRDIEMINFDTIKIPVIDLQSLYCAKLRHTKALKIEEEKYKNKLENCNKDIKIIENLLKKEKAPIKAKP